MRPIRKWRPRLCCIDPFDASGDGESSDLYGERAGRLDNGLRNTFELGVYLGASGLAAAGLTLLPAQVVAGGPPAYPHMLAWLRD